MKKTIFQEGKKYTFSDYFNMVNPIEEILAELGYYFLIKEIFFLKLPTIDEQVIENLTTSYYAILPKISLNSEIAKREVMIVPILQSLLKTVNAKLKIEYPLEIDDKLSGIIDYFFRSSNNLIVIQAKNGDLEKGFNQLAAEMIALDKYEENQAFNNIYGAITIGEIWRFSLLESNIKTVVKDIHTYRFPEDLKDIFAILKGILTR